MLVLVESLTGLPYGGVVLEDGTFLYSASARRAVVEGRDYLAWQLADAVSNHAVQALGWPKVFTVLAGDRHAAYYATRAVVQVPPSSTASALLTRLEGGLPLV